MDKKQLKASLNRSRIASDKSDELPILTENNEMFQNSGMDAHPRPHVIVEPEYISGDRLVPGNHQNPHEESKMSGYSKKHDLSAVESDLVGSVVRLDDMPDQKVTKNQTWLSTGRNPPIAVESEPSADSTQVHSSCEVLSRMVDAHKEKEIFAGDNKTTTQILDEIAERGPTFEKPEESSDQRSTYSIDINIQQNYPHALVNDHLIYYDATEKCLIARNPQIQAGRKIELYRLAVNNDEAESGVSTPTKSIVRDEKQGSKSIDARYVQFINSYEKWVIITSSISHDPQRMHQNAEGLLITTRDTGLEKTGLGVHLVQYYNCATYQCEREFRTDEQIIQQECNDYLLVLMLKTRKSCQYRINVYSDQDKQMLPLKSILLNTQIARAGNLNMLLSNNMDISIYDEQAQSCQSHIFNIANEGDSVDLEKCATFKQKANNKLISAFNAKRYERPGLSEVEIEELKEAFDLIDEDGSGRISPIELKAAMEKLGLEERNQTIFQMVHDLSLTDDESIDFLEFLAMIPETDRAYAYTTGYRQLALVEPRYLMTGRPFGKSYEMVVWDTISHQKIYEHTFDLHLQCTSVSKDRRQIMFLLADRKSNETQVQVLNLEQMKIQRVFGCSDYYEKIFIAEKFFFLTCDQEENGNENQGEASPTPGKNLVITFDDLAGDLFYKIIKMLASLKRPQDKFNVIYKPELENKVIYPQMINVTHVYAYYGAHSALKECIDNNVQLMLSTDNESALSIVVKHAETDNDILNDIIKHMIQSAPTDEEKTVLDFKEQCKIQSHLRPIQYCLTELNKTNIAQLPLLYEVLSLPVQAENIHIDEPISKVLESAYPDSARFDLGDSNKSFEKYAVQNYLRKHLIEKAYNKEEVNYKVSAILLNYSIGSVSCMQFLQSLITLRDQNILKIDIVKQYTQVLWTTAWWIHFILFIFYLLQTATMCVYVMLLDDEIALQIRIPEIMIVATGVSALCTVIYAFIQACISNLQLVVDIINLKSSAILRVIDILASALTFRYVGDFLVKIDGEYDPYDNLQGLIALLWIRMLLQMRVFRKTRHVIMTIAAVIKKGMPFAIILIIAVITGAFSSLVGNESSNFEKYFLERFLYLFGEFPDDIGDTAIIATVGFTFGACLIAINLYIAIVSDIFDEFQSNKDLIEVQTQLWMILDVGKLVWFWNKKDHYRYFHNCSPKSNYYYEDGNWEGKVKQLERTITDSHRETREGLEGLKGEVETKFRKLSGQTQAEIKSLKQDYGRLNEKIDILLEQLGHRSSS